MRDLPDLEQTNGDIAVPDSKPGEGTSEQECPQCHKKVPADAPMGLCPSCLFAQALEAPQEKKRIGEYELLEFIARGGMGVVYKARNARPGRIEALKMIASGELASDVEVALFQAEAKAASELDYPNIVPIYFVGEENGCHYFTMKWMSGGSLADHIDRYRGNLRGTAEFVATIARAVDYGHKRGILHRDLKPGNILLDEKGEPHVADFGLAKRLDHHGGVHSYSGGVGTPCYMSPEQARGESLSTASDVYSLGVILYELLTGEVPFDGEDAPKIIQQVLHRPPPHPRAIDPHIDLDLATICLRCLEKDPENRYQSAEDLVREIQRYLEGEPIYPVGKVKRAWRWCKRRPLTAALVVESVLLLVIATLAVFSGATAQEKDRREEVLRANEYSARWVAGTVLFKLNSYHDIVAKAAREFPREHIELLRKGEVKEGNGLEDYCKELEARHGAADGLHDWFVQDKEGIVRARWGRYERDNERLDVLGKSYPWRDYFKGAMKLGEARSRSAYIARAILSEPNGTQRYALSAPIYDENDEPIGVLITTTTTGAAFGTLDLKDPSDTRHIAMVVAPRDNNRDTRDKPLPEDHVILVHDSLASGVTAPLKSNAAVHAAVKLAQKSNPNRGLSQLLLADPNAVAFDESFCDPVMDGSCVDESGKTRPGRWLAGFAPIGHTGFVAIVETPREAAAAPNQTLGRRLLLWGVLPFMFGTTLVAGVVGYARRRMSGAREKSDRRVDGRQTSSIK
ncbi:MAG TPA: protein kinase [Polyangium sp.]|nr:protein kinase [Polyangium sp.]